MVKELSGPYITHLLEHSGELSPFPISDPIGDSNDLHREGVFKTPLSEHLKTMQTQWKTTASMFSNPMEHVTNIAARTTIAAFQRAAHQGKLDDYFSLPALADSLGHIQQYAEDHEASVSPKLESAELEYETKKYNTETARRITERIIPDSQNPLIGFQRRVVRYGIEHHVLRNTEYMQYCASMFHGTEQLPKSYESYLFSKVAHGIACSVDSSLSSQQAAQKTAEIAPDLLARFNYGVHPGLSKGLVWTMSKLMPPSESRVRYVHQSLVEKRILPWLRT